MANTNETLGKRIMNMRKNACMTQEQLADKLGVTPQAVSKWENDVSCPDISMMPRIAEVFGVTTDELFGIEGARRATVTAAAAPVRENGHSHVFEGAGMAVILIVIGAAYLFGRNLNVPFNLWDIIWPAVIMALGIAMAVKEWSVLGLGVGFFGFYHLLANIGEPLPFEFGWNVIWPVALILLGVNIITDRFLGRYKKRAHGAEQWASEHGHNAERSFSEENGFINYDASFGEDSRSVMSPTVNGARCKISFGESTLDFSNVRNFSENCELSFNVSFGSCNLYLPRTVQVVNCARASFGSVDVENQPAPDAQPIRITGSVSFGALEITYR